MLVIAIQVVAMSQMQENQINQVKNPLTMSVKRTKTTKQVVTPVVNEESVPEQFSKKITELNEQIVELEKLKQQINEEINTFFASQKKREEERNKLTNSIPITTSITLSKAEMITYLLNESDELNNSCIQLRNEANKAKGGKRNELFAASKSAFESALLKQIEASELSYLITKDKYNENMENLNTLLFNSQDKPYTCAKVNHLILQAAHSLQMAEEIREETKQLTDNSAKLGNLGNAEENEFMAITKQVEALSYFGTSYMASTKNKF